jgi:hypothetical protein
MKKLMSTCVFALSLTAFAQGASAGNWATFTQGRSIISSLKTLNDNQIKTAENVKDVEAQVESSIEEAADRIIAALRSHSGEQSAYQDKQIEAAKRITDASEMNATERMRQEFRAKAESGEFDPNPGMCLLAGLYRDSGSTTSGSTGAATVQAVAQQNNGGDAAVVQGGTTYAKSVIDDRERLEGALGGISDPTLNPAALTQNPTITLEDDEDTEALTRLMRNLVDPLPPRPVTALEKQTPEGVARAHARAVQEARNYASADVVAMITNMGKSVGPVEPWEPYIEDISNYNRPVGDEISELQAIDIRTLRHYAPKPEVFQERASWSEKQLLQEILDVMSINTRIAYVSLELDRRRAIVETQLLSVLNNGNG